MLFAKEKQIGRVEDPDTAVTNRNTGRDVQSIGKNADLAGMSALIHAVKNLDPIPPGARRLAWILDAFRKPDTPAIVEGHRDWIDDVRFAGHQLDLEPLGDGHFAERLLGRIR